MSPRCAALVAELRRLERVFDFTHEGLGEQAAEANAVGIFEYMEAQTGPDNNPWVELSEDYARRKARVAPGARMAELNLLMKAPDQLKGTLDVSPDRLVQTYGTNDRARDEAAWFQEGDETRNRPPRPFYDFNDLVLVLLAALFDERFERFTT